MIIEQLATVSTVDVDNFQRVTLAAITLYTGHVIKVTETTVGL